MTRTKTLLRETTYMQDRRRTPTETEETFKQSKPDRQKCLAPLLSLGRINRQMKIPRTILRLVDRILRRLTPTEITSEEIIPDVETRTAMPTTETIIGKARVAGRHRMQVANRMVVNRMARHKIGVRW
jgi:hypothetical protein